jgi:flagellar basal body-associated protein FliL
MKKILLFGGIGLALVVLTAVAMFFVLGSRGGGGKTVMATPVPHFTVGPTYTMQTRVVNLADAGANRYLKITVVLAFSPTLDSQGTVDSRLKAREVVLQDILTTILSNLTTDQLAQSQGKDTLKQALMGKFAPVLNDLHLADIYFPEFVMQ